MPRRLNGLFALSSYGTINDYSPVASPHVAPPSPALAALGNRGFGSCLILWIRPTSPGISRRNRRAEARLWANPTILPAGRPHSTVRGFGLIGKLGAEQKHHCPVVDPDNKDHWQTRSAESRSKAEPTEFSGPG